MCRKTGIAHQLTKVLPYVTMEEYIISPWHMRALLGCTDKALCTPIDAAADGSSAQRGSEFWEEAYWPLMPSILGHVDRVHPPGYDVPRLLLTFLNVQDWGNSKVYFERWKAGLLGVYTRNGPVDGIDFYSANDTPVGTTEVDD